MVDFGWSASCILEAIKLSNKIRKALQDAGGAKDQYREATSFLTQFECVFKELEGYICSDTETTFREATLQQLELMEPPWSRLQGLLGKYEATLGSSSAKSKFNIISRKVKWALKDLNEAVRKERGELQGPLQTVSLLLQMQAMNTIQKTNEKCHKIVEDIEVSDFAKSLQRNFENLRSNSERMRAGQEETQTCLARLKESLDFQHSGILDALREEHKAHGTSTQDVHIAGYEHGNCSATSESGPRRLVDQESSFEQMHAQLKEQQTSLDNIYKALQCLATDFNKEVEEEQSTQDVNKRRKFTVADAMSMIKVAVTTGSIFTFGFSLKTAVALNHLRASPACPTESSTIGYRRPQTQTIESITQQRMWTTEFTSFNAMSQQNRITGADTPSAQRSHLATSNIQSSVQASMSVYYTWNCCQCGGGPYTKGRKTCWGCWNAFCEQCPRTAFPFTLERHNTCSSETVDGVVTEGKRSKCEHANVGSTTRRRNSFMSILSSGKQLEDGAQSAERTSPSGKSVGEVASQRSNNQENMTRPEHSGPAWSGHEKVAGKSLAEKATRSIPQRTKGSSNGPKGVWTCNECGSVCLDWLDICSSCGTPKL